MTVRILIRFPRDIALNLGPLFPQTQQVLSTFPEHEHPNCKIIVQLGIRNQARQAALDFLKLKLIQAQHSKVDPAILPEDIQFFRNYFCNEKSKDLDYKR